MYSAPSYTCGMALEKIATSFRLTKEAIQKLRVLAELRGVNSTAMIEMLIRDEADRKGVNLQPNRQE